MANLEQIISNKASADAAWKEQRQMERFTAADLRDAGITEITSNPTEYRRYLDLQGQNPTYSAGNLAIVQFSMESPTKIGTVERWRSLGRTVIESEKNEGVKIFARSAEPNRGYILADAYNITQTTGKAVKDIKLTDSTPQMETALATLLNYSPVPVVSEETLEDIAYYDADEMKLYVCPTSTDSEAFSAIAREITLARIHSKGNNTAYSRESSYLDADSVSYILCKRFSIERDLPDTSGVSMLYEGLDVSERIEALDSIHNLSKQIGRSIDISIAHDHSRAMAKTSHPAR